MTNIDENSVFIKLDEYNESLNYFEQLKSKIQEAEKTLEKIEKLKEDEDTEIELWHNSVREINKKINHIDDLIISTKK
ncbi:MAG: hypothetical protein ACOCQG_03520 [Candidatus Nanoarchaeia archaeon]